MTESLIALVFGADGSSAAWVLAATGVVVTVATMVGLVRQRAALVRLDERMAHLTAAVTLLTNTTEEGWRRVAAELSRTGREVSAAADTAPEAPPPSIHERVARAAAHGRTVQDIAGAEGISEAEVLLHLLVSKMQPEETHAQVC